MDSFLADGSLMLRQDETTAWLRANCPFFKYSSRRHLQQLALSLQPLSVLSSSPLPTEDGGGIVFLQQEGTLFLKTPDGQKVSPYSLVVVGTVDQQAMLEAAKSEWLAAREEWVALLRGLATERGTKVVRRESRMSRGGVSQRRPMSSGSPTPNRVSFRDSTRSPSCGDETGQVLAAGDGGISGVDSSAAAEPAVRRGGSNPRGQS